ncbi:glycosyltransferase [Thermodesulfobacteriota bacterium]
MPSSLKLKISVIIPVHNGGEEFEKCLSSVSDCNPPAEEVIVVVDGDNDQNRHMAEEFRFKALTTSTVGGPGRARNLGARSAKGDILFFVDADVTLPRDTIGRVKAAFRNDPDMQALFGSYDDEPSEPNFLSQYKNLFHHYVHQTSAVEASTFWGACGAIYRDIFFKINGFDEAWVRASGDARPGVIEDIELGYRLKRAGYKIRLLKDLQVKHLKRWGVFSLVKTDFFYRALPWTELILGGRGFIDELNLKTSNKISVISIYLLIIMMMGTFFMPILFVPGIFIILLIFGLNWDFYLFYQKKRGFLFTLKAIPLHWFYFFYCGLGFILGFASYYWKMLFKLRDRG